VRDRVEINVIHRSSELQAGGHGLEPSSSDPLHLMILLKDISASLHGAGGAGS
jgi:hypothetical protein